MEHILGMSHPTSKAARFKRAGDCPRTLPDDLYGYTDSKPWPRSRRPSAVQQCVWTVTDDLPRPLPVTAREVDVFEPWFGDIFDELFGDCP